MKQESIYADFLDIFGMEADNSFLYPEGIINPTIDALMTEFRRQVNGLKNYTPAEKQYVFRDVMERISVNKQQKNNLHFKSSISREKRREIMRCYARENRRIAAEFRGIRDGELFDEDTDTSDQPDEVTERGLTEDFIKIFADLTLGQNRVNQELRDRIDRMETGLGECLKAKDMVISKNMEENHMLRQQITEQALELEAIKKSTCWRMTKPLRVAVDLVKKGAKRNE